jgi:hypothetical protein
MANCFLQVIELSKLINHHSAAVIRTRGLHPRTFLEKLASGISALGGKKLKSINQSIMSQVPPPTPSPR